MPTKPQMDEEDHEELVEIFNDILQINVEKMNCADIIRQTCRNWKTVTAMQQQYCDYVNTEGQKYLQSQSCIEKMTTKLTDTKRCIKVFYHNRIHDRLLPYASQRWCFCALISFILIIQIYHVQTYNCLLYPYGALAFCAIHSFFEPRYGKKCVLGCRSCKQSNAHDDDAEYMPFVKVVDEFQLWIELVMYAFLAFAVSSCKPKLIVFQIQIGFVIFTVIDGFSILFTERIFRMLQYGYSPWPINCEKKTDNYYINTRLEKGNALYKKKKINTLRYLQKVENFQV